MALKYDIKKDLRYKEGLEDGIEKGIEKGLEKGLEKGREEERRKGIKQLLKLGKLSIAEIAQSFEVDVALVEAIKEGLDA